MKYVIALTMGLMCTSCQTTKCDRIVVDISQKRLKVYNGSMPVYSSLIETGRAGIGHTLGSGKTPTGTFNIVKEPKHRFGPVFRLSGFQGNSRGILVHKDLSTRVGSGGCVVLPGNNMKKLYDIVDDDAVLIIKT